MKPRLKPMGIGTILDNSLTILRENFWTFQKVNFLAYLPALIILLIGTIVVVAALFPYIQQFGSYFSGEMLDQMVYQNGLAILLAGLFFIAFIVAMIIGSIYLSYGNMNLFRSGLHQEKCSAKQAFKGLKGKKLRFLGAQFLLSLMSLPIFIISIIVQTKYSAGQMINYLSYIVQFLFCMVTPVVFFEKLGLSASISRGFSLMSKHRWRVLLCLILAYLLGYILLVTIMLLIAVPVALGFIFKNLITIVLASLFGLAGLVFFGTMVSFLYGPLVAIYYDLLIRKEGYDIQQQLEGEKVNLATGQGIEA